MIRGTVIGIAVAVALSATAGYAVQDFTLDEAQTRIERLEARVAALEATMAAGNGRTEEAPETHGVTGTVLIADTAHFGVEGRVPYEVGDACFGDAGLDGFQEGAEVRALDEAGTVVGLGHLRIGTLTDLGTLNRGCQFTWTMDVTDAEFYAFDIANQGGPSFQRAELEAAGWDVGLSLGD